MMTLKMLIYSFIQNYRKRNLKVCGQNVRISKDCMLQGNIEIGDNVTIGYGNYFVSAGATLYIKDNVVFGPNVTIYTGDHPVNIIGKHISEISGFDKKKLVEKIGVNPWDKDVIIESGCWIGTRAIILKGVTVGRGSIIGAGAIVTKDVPPYSIYTGIPKQNIRQRFNSEEIMEHEQILKERRMI